MSVVAEAAVSSRVTDRYERRRQEIISAATELLNLHGAKGMRLADVAAKLGLTTTSVTYYYRRKEDLAVACFDIGLDYFEGLIAQAGKEADPARRVRRLIELYLQAQARIRRGEQAPLPLFSDIRAVKEPHHARLVAAYHDLLRQVGALLERPGQAFLSVAGRTARGQVLFEQLLWSRAWLHRYSIDDFPRLVERMTDILADGLAAPGCGWAPRRLPLKGPACARDVAGQEMFLDVATRLINARGYRGASVNEIAAQLNLTKGSFYHHIEAKDDVVVACFKRSYNLMRSVQRQVRDLDADEWTRLTTAAAALVDYQLSPQGPLLRTSALMALPMDLRVDMVGQSQKVSDHFASMISDGVAEGCVRPVDPFVASQMLVAMINAASDLPVLEPDVGREDVVDLYAKPLMTGLLKP